MGATAIAAFVSPHGFGHAARCCALMEALARARPWLRFEVFTTVPGWFFAESLTVPFALHRLHSDVGLVQRTSLVEDIEATVAALDRFLPLDSRLVSRLGERLDGLACHAVLCDISPLGLAVARHAGLPAVLVENFTWDWIYRAYADDHPRLAGHATLLSEIFATADLHLQATPVCERRGSALTVAPLSRRPRTDRAATRARLGLLEHETLVLLTLSGMGWEPGSLQRLEDHRGVVFVVPGASSETARRGGLITLPRQSTFYHPDLVHASDVVVGKLGYSTVAETYHAGTRLAWVPRPRFPESAVLALFARAEMPSMEVAAETFDSLDWLHQLEDLLATPTAVKPRANGDDEAARLICELLDVVRTTG